jgi:hypothetical protein
MAVTLPSHGFATIAGAMVPMMTDKQIDLVTVVMEMIGGTIDNYDEDPYHAPARWVLNNWWHTLNAVLALQVGDHADSKTYSFEATDKAESEKGNEHVEPDE